MIKLGRSCVSLPFRLEIVSVAWPRAPSLRGLVARGVHASGMELRLKGVKRKKTPTFRESYIRKLHTIVLVLRPSKRLLLDGLLQSKLGSREVTKLWTGTSSEMSHTVAATRQSKAQKAKLPSVATRRRDFELRLSVAVASFAVTSDKDRKAAKEDQQT